MKLLVLNPNRSVRMTEQAVAEVRRLAGARAQVRGLTAADGPPVIASRASFAAGAQAALALWPAADDGWADAVLLACFGDPGLQALRATSRVPVLGMAECALQAMVDAGRRFHIVTAGAAWDAMLREQVALHPGAAPLFDGLTVLAGTGLALAEQPDAGLRTVQSVLDHLGDDGAPACILGGTGFAAMRARLSYRGLLLDGLQTAVARVLP